MAIRLCNVKFFEIFSHFQDGRIKNRWHYILINVGWVSILTIILTYHVLSFEQDLSKLNRDPRKIIYLSAHARENSLQPENGAPIKPFKVEGDDTALLDFIPFLECK